MARILIVDDAPRNCILFEALMEAEGYVALSVGSGEEALAHVARQRPDLILLDVMMPDMSGYDVAKILKADPATADIPLIMVTARVEPGARLAALESGADHFLTKPVDQAELALTVHNLLRLKAYGSGPEGSSPNPALLRFV
jgi:CheY-like chemotaxis protein